MNMESILTQLVIVTQQYLTRKFFYSVPYFTQTVLQTEQIYTNSLLRHIQNATKANISCIFSTQ